MFVYAELERASNTPAIIGGVLAAVVLMVGPAAVMILRKRKLKLPILDDSSRSSNVASTPEQETDIDVVCI